MPILLLSLLLSTSEYFERRCNLAFEYPEGWRVESDASRHLAKNAWDCSSENDAFCDPEGRAPCDVWIADDANPNESVRVEVYDAPDDCFVEVAKKHGFLSLDGDWRLTSNTPPTRAQYVSYRGREMVTGRLKYYRANGDEAPGGLHKVTVIGDENGVFVIRSPQGAQSVHDRVVQTIKRSPN